MELITLLSPRNLVGFVIVFTRISGMLLTAPLFSTYPMPTQVKFFIAGLTAFIMFPIVFASNTSALPVDMIGMTCFLLKELVIGLIIGFVANFVFAAAQMAGQVVSLQAGLSMSNVLDPVSGTNLPVLSNFYSIMLAGIFLALDAHNWLFMAVYQSFVKIPPGLEMFQAPMLVEQILRMSAEIFTVSLSLVMPIFCILFVLEVLMGVLAKMIPQMNIFMVAIPLKVLVGIALMAIFVQPVSQYMIKAIQIFILGTMGIFN
jgi:flagellar biosynthetic protein FliR